MKLHHRSRNEYYKNAYFAPTPSPSQVIPQNKMRAGKK